MQTVCLIGTTDTCFHCRVRSKNFVVANKKSNFLLLDENKYRDNNYDRMELAVPKGMKASIKEIAKEQGYSSQNSYVVEAIKEKYQRDTGKELTWNKE